MRSAILPRALSAIISAGAVLAIGAILVVGRPLGPLSLHMSLHILAMNIAGPALAALIVARAQPTADRPAWLWAATVGQLAALWVAHVPWVHSSAAASHVLQAGMHGILLLASLLFWIAVLAVTNAARWHAIAALLLSGKLVCFLAVLLIFAPRTLYGKPLHATGIPALADQQFAGLLMVAACPLSYLLAAVILTVQLINERPVASTARKAG